MERNLHGTEYRREAEAASERKEHLYRGGTLNALSAMLTMAETGMSVDEAFALIEQEEAGQSRVLYIPENTGGEENGGRSGFLRYCVPSDLERSNSILLEPLAEGLKKGELAKDYYHINPTQLSMLIRPGYKHKINPNLVLSALLMPRELPALDDVNHILMELGQPGLYDRTGDFQENRRSRMLINLFDYARDHECPRERWLFLANDMLRYLEMKPLYREKNSRWVVLSPEEKALFNRWNAAAGAVPREGDYMVFRRECFERYRARLGLSITEAQEKIGKAVSIGVDSVKNVLCATRAGIKTRSSRPTLALMAIELGCDLDEANRILMEAGYPLLYPFRESDEDRDYIYRLLGNSRRARGAAV